MKDSIELVEHLKSPLVKWPGGKRWFAQKYADCIKKIPYKRVVEPFAGGLALSFALAPQKVLANDINPHLINFYQQIKNGRFEPLDLLLPSSEEYYSLREKFNLIIKNEDFLTPLAASYFFALNRIGYNGLCRFNDKGFFNVPYGRYKKIKWDFAWDAYSDLFEKWTFVANSYRKIKLNKTDLLFCDPPYDGSFSKYSKQSFNFDDHVHLAKWASSHQGPVMLMNNPSKRIISLYLSEGFDIHYLQAPRAISRLAESRGVFTEILAVKNFSWNAIVKEI